MSLLQRIEKTFQPEQWPGPEHTIDLLAFPTQFSGLEQYSLPAERVVVASQRVDLRDDNVSRIRNMFIADAIDIDINHAGTVRSYLQLALRNLAHGLHGEHLDRLVRRRYAGEWLLNFFQQHIPLGAICMMGKQTVTYVDSLCNIFTWSAELTILDGAIT